MLFRNDHLFSIVRSAKLGQVALPPVLAQLRDWIREEYGVSIVHIVFDRIGSGPNTGRPRLNVILETDTDYDSWKADAVTIRPDVKRRVLSEFVKRAQADPETYDAEQVLLAIDNFSGECLGRACAAFLKNDADRIVKAFSGAPIWKIDGFSRFLAVFLERDEDVKMRTADGTCESISTRCFEAVKRYDEFGYLSAETFHLKFDSKENLDKNFNGSLFYYWR